MVLVAGGMWLPGYRHEPQAKLVEPTVHALVEAAEPGGGIFIGIMIVEGVDHLPHLRESIHKGKGGGRSVYRMQEVISLNRPNPPLVVSALLPAERFRAQAHYRHQLQSPAASTQQLPAHEHSTLSRHLLLKFGALW